MPVLLGFLRQEHGRPPRHRWGWGQFWHLQAGVWLCPGCWVKDWGLYHRLYWHSEPLNIGHFCVFRRENDGFLNFPPGGGAPLRFGWNQCRTSPILYIYQDQLFFCWQMWPPISSHFGNSRYTCLLSKKGESRSMTTLESPWWSSQTSSITYPIILDNFY